MILAVISDIHANLEALEAVMRDIEKHKTEQVYCLGDVIGYGSDPIACLDLVEKNCALRLMGNHECAVLGKLPMYQLNQTAKVSIAWTVEQLGERIIPGVSDLPIESTRDGFRFVHASPFEPGRWHYILTQAEAQVAFNHFPERMCFCGHSHLPMIFSSSENRIHRQAGHDFQPNEDTRYIVNVGSVGQPRDNDPRAGYVTYDTTEDEVFFHRVDYDISATQSKMRQAELPALLIERLRAGI